MSMIPEELAFEPLDAPEAQLMMHNPKLMHASDTFWTDSNQLVEQRCIFLFQGYPDNVEWNPNLPIPDHLDAFKVKVDILKPDDGNLQKQIGVDVKLDNLMVEVGHDFLESVTVFIPEFFLL